MGKYVTVSVKIPVEVKEKLDRLGIKPSKLLKKAIEEEIKRAEIKAIKGDIMRMKELLDRIPIEDVIKSIREDRDSK